jgi:phenylacetic acid degradation operon negative regulatory protein
MKLISMAKQIPADELLTRVTSALETLDTEERKVKPEYIVKRTLKRLEDAGSIERNSGSDGRDRFSLTLGGTEKLHRASINTGGALMPTEWDGLWRMVILDFESEDKRARDAVRYMLKKANFLCIKQSIWITPHNLEGFIEEMKYHMKLTSEVLFVLATRIDPTVERDTKEYFGIE